MKIAAGASLMLAVACSKDGPQPAAPTPPPKIVYVVATPTHPGEPEPIWTPEPTPEVQSTTVVVALPAPRPTTDLRSIPDLDRPRDPTPAGRTEQLAGCLTFSAEGLSQPGFSGMQRMRVRVRARNNCNSWIPVDDSWFEIVSTGAASGGTIGREVGRFQAPIAPRSADNETMIEIDCPSNLPGGCRFTASVWWAAGGGRKAE